MADKINHKEMKHLSSPNSRHIVTVLPTFVQIDLLRSPTSYVDQTLYEISHGVSVER